MWHTISTVHCHNAMAERCIPCRPCSLYLLTTHRVVGSIMAISQNDKSNTKGVFYYGKVYIQ